jgi:hypothetical protein
VKHQLNRKPVKELSLRPVGKQHSSLRKFVCQVLIPVFTRISNDLPGEPFIVRWPVPVSQTTLRSTAGANLSNTMKLSKAFLFCLGFCWASFLLDIYAAFQTGYWSMLAATGGIRLLMTAIGLAWHIPGRSAQVSPPELQQEDTACPAYGGMAPEPFMVWRARSCYDASKQVPTSESNSSRISEGCPMAVS